ncbi:DoxX family membrane protein [bacterium]|nr:MAG: DoxX family membrane protein [bacterium]
MAEHLPSAQRYAGWLAAVRIYTGAFWLIHGAQKIVMGEFAAANGTMVQIVTQFVSKTSGPYHDFLLSVVLTHGMLFGQLVQWGETLAGVSLLLGLLTRAGGIVGTFLALNYWIAKGSFGNPADYTVYESVAVVLSLLNVVLPTGRVFGLDGLRLRRSRHR